MYLFTIYVLYLLFYWLGRKVAQLQIIAPNLTKIYYDTAIPFFNKCPSPHARFKICLPLKPLSLGPMILHQR